jgi:uncharacterized integral membrane protein (TIGR00698 family)
MPRDFPTSFAAATVPMPVRRGPRAILAALLPGLGLTLAIALLGFVLNRVPLLGTFSPLILSITLGMLFHNVVRTPASCIPGVKFSLRRILRFAIVLLGLQLTVGQVLAVGGAGLAIVVATLAATFGFTLWLGRRLGVDPKLSRLIAAGTSICGASAVIAANAVTEGSDEDVAYAVACVTVFGSLAMLIFPLFPAALHLDPHAFGLWAGASIHEIAQVVAAAFQDGKAAGDLATVTKLARVMLLAPVVILLGLASTRARRSTGVAPTGRTAPPIPWFALGFVAVIGFNSLDLLAAAAKADLVQLTTLLLSMALAAMGLETDMRKLKAEGWRPLLLGAGAWVFIASFSLLLIKLIIG